MSNTKTVMGQASNQYVTPLDITDVFSTYLYEGTNQADTIVNNIDLSGEGGMTWIKERTGTSGNVIFDTERGATKRLISYATNAESTAAFDVTAFNSDGFSVGDSIQVNGPSRDYASWTFRKAPKFFTCVTWTGDGTSNRTLSHSLGSTPGMIIAKSTSTTTSWMVWHTSMVDDEFLRLNTTGGQGGYGSFYEAGINSTTFGVSSTDANYGMNINGATYVAYLFAHNDGDGEFGPDSDQDIIKCGSYTGNGSTDGPEIDLGFEPQWILLKGASAASNWLLYDVMRGLTVGTTNAGADQLLQPHTSNAEYTDYHLSPTPTGFRVRDTGGDTNTSGNTYIYMAIRRGTKVPESGTEAFHIQSQSNGDTYSVGFPNDLLLLNKTGGSSANTYVGSRLTGGDKYLVTSSTAAEGTSSGLWSFDLQDSFDQGASTASPWVGYHWKRAPGFFDVVAYTGNSTAGRTVSHNLGVVPEMMWVKMRSGGTAGWGVYHKDIGATNYLNLNNTTASAASVWYWNNTTPTESVFTLGGGTLVNLSSSYTYIAYLFATLPGVSKVGSYTGNGSSQTIDCGFTSGARFVLIKDTTGGNWFLYDSVRGITSGSDPALRLNLTSAEVSTADAIAPNSSGFIVQASYFNNSGDTYIFYAIA